LDHALLDPGVIGTTISNFQELHLAVVLVHVLLEFLRGKLCTGIDRVQANISSKAERPSPEVSATYFFDGARLADRFVTILSVALEMNESAAVVQDCYGVILEASLHSRVVWEAFVKNPDILGLHKTLLLTETRQPIREQVSRSIASVCGGDLPSTCPLTKGELATQFWHVISSIIPDSVHWSGQSQQFFEIAELVFRAQDEYERNEISLRSFLTQWSDLLLSHQHQEFVGRGEIDHVILGFTKLLLCCILSLKSFKKPLGVGDLMEQIFKKYMFAKRYVIKS
jgi:ubiquitin carboxyl-terminal hydrolase 34